MEAAAARRTRLAAQMDIAPTLLSILGLRPMPGVEGKNLVVEEDRVVLSETHPPHAGESLYSARDNEYKLVFRPRSDDFLMYALGPDPGELDNVFELQGHLRKNWQAELRRRARVELRTSPATLGP